jgi:hypothetical protein
MRLLLLIGFAMVSLGLTWARGADEAATKTFPEKKCRYTLPGPDWTWVDVKAPDALCLARDDKGFVVTLSALAEKAAINDAFVRGFEKGFLKSPNYRKRGGHRLDFLGLPAYQLEVATNDGHTLTSRVFMAHDIGYIINCIGNADPVENDPRFEKMLAGFAFTVPPDLAAERAKSERGGTDDFSYRMGQIVGYCMMGIVVLFIVRKFRGR